MFVNPISKLRQWGVRMKEPTISLMVRPTHTMDSSSWSHHSLLLQYRNLLTTIHAFSQNHQPIHLCIPIPHLIRFAEPAFQRDCLTFIENKAAVDSRFSELDDQLKQMKGQFHTALHHFQRTGEVEILPSLAVPSFLPFIQHKTIIQANIELAIEVYQRTFGIRPKGFMLEGSGYHPVVNSILNEWGIRYFIVDSQTLLQATPSPPHNIYAPIQTSHQLAVFAIDEPASQQMKNLLERPHDEHVQLNFNAPTTLDTPLHLIQLAIDANPSHTQTLSQLTTTLSPYPMTTLSNVLDTTPSMDQVTLPPCSQEAWLNKHNDWIYPQLFSAESKLLQLIQDNPTPRPPIAESLKEAIGELLLSQCSEWALAMNHEDTREQGHRHYQYHYQRFLQWYDSMQPHTSIEMPTSDVTQSGLFQWINLEAISSQNQNGTNMSLKKSKHCVLMLSWEYPPRGVGGLSVAVHELARHLVLHDIEVHVITSMAEYAPKYEQMKGVHVHRVDTYFYSNEGDFFNWIFHLNLEMVDEMERLYQEGLRPDIVHVHDWLVYFATDNIKKTYQLPIIVSFHGLQQPRNQISKLPGYEEIHNYEEKLSQIADHVITCSQSMKVDLQQILAIPPSKISVVLNGIDLTPARQITPDLASLRQQYAPGDDQIVLFVGRLVAEKGVQLLLSAAPAILEQYPRVRFLIAGTGYLEQALKEQAKELGITEQVSFLGFIPDQLRDELYCLADICVFPSLFEPFGIVALEAMSFKTPIIVSRIGGLAEIITHHENGLIMENNDVESLVTQLQWMIQYPDRAKCLAEQAYKDLAVHYDWSHLASQSLTIYQKRLENEK